MQSLILVVISSLVIARNHLLTLEVPHGQPQAAQHKQM
jgi:hypothetical protein